MASDPRIERAAKGLFEAMCAPAMTWEDLKPASAATWVGWASACLAAAGPSEDEARVLLQSGGWHRVVDRALDAERERDEARAEVAALREARDELDALRELADAAARRIALREAVDTWERVRVTAGEAFAATGVAPGDILGDREWLREYRAARALRGGDGHE